MSAMEKHVVQIFEKTKQIIDQSRQQCHLWEHHLFPKLLLNGIAPPPWLSNYSLHSRISDPQDLNKDDLLSEVLLSQPQLSVPFPGHHCSLYSNLDVVSDAIQYPIGFHDDGRALKKDCNTADRLSNLPDCSVNEAGCASSGPPEFDSDAVSPQNQLEPRDLDSHHDPALSLAKLQRSKSRQRALELRKSAKAVKRWSGDDNNTRVCAGTLTGSASPIQQAEHVMESDLVKDFHSNVRSCSMEEMTRHDCVTQKDKSNYSSRSTRFKSSSQNFNSSNGASSSVEKEDGPPPCNLNKSLEMVNQPCSQNESCDVKEANKGENQCKEAGRSVYNNKRLTKSKSSSQARYNSELLKRDRPLGSVEGVETGNIMLPFTHVEQTDLSKASDCNGGSRRNTVKDGDFCPSKLESNIHSRIRLLGSSCPLPGDDFLMTDCSVKSIDKSVQSPQLLISQNSQDPTASVVGSFSSQKDPDLCVVKTKEHLSRSGSGKVYITRDSKSQNHAEEVLKSSRSNSCMQNATCSESAGKKSQNLWLTEIDAKRSSSSPKHSKLDIEIDMNYAEKENISALATSRNIRAVTTCANEVLLRPASSSNLVGGPLLAEVHIERAGGEKVLNTQENILSGAIPTDNVEHISATTLGKVDADDGGLVEKDPCVSPKVGLNVSVLRMPSDFAMSVMPKQLDFDDAEETSINGVCSPDLKGGQQAMSPEEDPLNSLEPVKLLEEESSLVCQDKHNSSGEMHLLESPEVLIREEGLRMENFASLFEDNIAMTALNTMPPNKELSMVQKEFSSRRSSLMNHSSPSLVAGENSSGSLSKEVMASKLVSVNNKQKNDDSSPRLGDSSSEAVTEHGLHKYTDENVTNIPVGFPFAVPLDNVTVGLAQQAPNSISLCQAGDLFGEALLGDGKVTGFSTEFQTVKSSTESFTIDVESSCPQQKRRKIEIETEKFLPASSNVSEKPLDLSIKESNTEIALEFQHLASNQEDNAGNQFVSDSPAEEMQHNRECQAMQGSSLKVRKEEKLILDGRDRSADILLLAEENLSGFNIDSTVQCTVDEKVKSWHHQVNCGQEGAEILTCVERSTSSRRIYPGGNAEFSDGMSVSPGIQCLDLIGTDETLPEFEGFIMQTDNAQSCIAGDQMELEKMNLPSNSIDYTSHGKSRFMHSPLCYSSTPYKLHNLPELYEPLPNGLLEDLGLRTSLPLKDGSPRSLSDCQPNYKAQYTSSVQTLWDRIHSNLGSSGKRKSLKLELPCISEENENVDETAATFQRGIGSEAMTGSITREPLAEIVDNASILQDDIMTGGREEIVSTEFNLSGTCNKVKNKLDKQHGNRRRFMSKGKENQNISLGANGVKRTTESVRQRRGRPKLSGKESMKQQGPTHSEVRSTCNNIVSNVSSFIPLVQQKQAAAAFTGKRDIKVKALEAAEAAKRMAEKKEIERKMKKEALKLEREKLELQNLRQMELQKKMKEEERKKKEAQMAAKKRQREDEEKREKERKRKRVNDTKKKEHDKIHAKKEEIEIRCRATDEEVQEGKKFMNERENHKNSQVQDKRESNVEKISVAELANRDSANDKTKESGPEYSEFVNDCANNGKVTDNLTKVTEDDDLIIKNTLQEQSYEISPYKGSDDEDEDEDDIPNNKFIPSWASSPASEASVTVAEHSDYNNAEFRVKIFEELH